jgi:hypothetical protein
MPSTPADPRWNEKPSDLHFPLEEQREIAAALDAQTDLLHRLVAEAERAMTLLQERCSALISAAVTGQVDVRGRAGRWPHEHPQSPSGMIF